MVPIARRLLPDAAVPWAVLLFAASEQLSWHACEAKPYAFDVFAATVLVFVYVVRLPAANERSLPYTLLLFALLAPVMLWLSYPACFLFGGVMIALLPAVWRERRPWTFAAFGLLAATVGVAFLALLLGPAKAQHDPVIHSDWTHCFPNWQRPWTVPVWLMASTVEVGRYACKPLGQGLMLFAFAGGFLLWRHGRRDVVALLAVPVGLALVASCLQKYPYGGVRVMVFAAPAILLLAAAAIPPALAWLSARHRLLAAALVLFLLLPVGVALLRVASPWPVADTASAAAFVQTHRRPDETVIGNDWTHLYYFRHLGSAFHCPEDNPLGPDSRIWVVFTEETPPEERFQSAEGMAPAGWHVLERFDSRFTTAALFAKE